MAQSIRAVVVDPSHNDKLVLRDVELPAGAPNEVTVRVTAISLNRGETNRALSQSVAGARPGWDFAGIIEATAADGSGPAAGTRVVGLLPTGAWAERVRAPSELIAALPDAVTDAQAATFPLLVSPRCTRCARAACCSGARCWWMAPPAASATSRSNWPPDRARWCMVTCVEPNRRR